MTKPHLVNRPLLLAVLAAGVLAAACSVGEHAQQSLMGPSEFALSVTMTAQPDQLPRDGFSQALVTVTVLDAQSQPVAGQRMALGVSPSTATVSVSSVTTGGDGKAQFLVTAPPSTGVGNRVVVSVVPEGTNANNSLFGNNLPSQQVAITMLGPSNATAPTPLFTFLPASPTLGQTVTFDASTTTDESVTCGANCTYAWSFGDGATATGQLASHSYSSAGTFQVRLTVTDALGTSASASKFVTIGVGTAPTAALVCSPSDPVPNQLVVCDAGGSTVAAGATLSSYAWVWGDGNTSTTTTAQASHPDGGYAADGTYTVRVTVTDSFGRTGTATASVEVDTP